MEEKKEREKDKILINDFLIMAMRCELKFQLIWIEFSLYFNQSMGNDSLPYSEKSEQAREKEKNPIFSQ